ncbi:type III secretion system export apparatus subunit SctR [Aquabacterium sp. A7-Y]|uniref:type III secretion system export apparatus subunit SctR n=1 Tax=Aquabacterium sp. A7-Y TaxID=1349605 RepID=UPI00223CAE0F|nr:type III secretion system export apparatus subunit SctR [Aquabacterium sp. A7-Y]MCW7536984.1 type III secretion system export apparatus subunit SctR [Aquabacterium sp. A7-Y]
MMGAPDDLFSLALVLGLMSLIPLLVITTTSFLKVSLVLVITRNAIGVQQVPPTLALYGIALAITAFIMAPTLQATGQRLSGSTTAATPGGGALRNDAPLLDRARGAFEPVRDFMIKFTRPEQRDIFLATAKRMWPPEIAKDATNTDVLVLVPAFVVSELQTGYEIGFLIYIPFVVIDLLVANILMALGMQQMSPQSITVPLKLLLFVMVDGWGKLLHGLALSYL